MKRAVVVLALALAAGCGSTTPQVAAPVPSPSPAAPAPGPDAWLAFAHDATFGSKNFAVASDDTLLAVGHGVCDSLAQADMSMSLLVEGLTASSARPTADQAEALVRAAVPNLCPEYATALP